MKTRRVQHTVQAGFFALAAAWSFATTSVKAAQPESGQTAKPQTASMNDPMANDQSMWDYLQKQGLSHGFWADEKMDAFADRLRWMGGGKSPPLEEIDRLIEEINASPTLTRFADDALFIKARVLFEMKKFAESEKLFRQIVTAFPDATPDLQWDAKGGRGILIVGPSGFPGDAHKLACGVYYAFRHPNKTADVARLEIAHCLLAAGDYMAARAQLEKLIPGGADARPLSEDPIARREEWADYVDGFEDKYEKRVMECRTDKIALLLLARAYVALGELEKAKQRYEDFFRLFPSSAEQAVRERSLLEKGKTEEIIRWLKEFSQQGQLQLGFSVSNEEIIKINDQPDLSKRLEMMREFLSITSEAFTDPAPWAKKAIARKKKLGIPREQWSEVLQIFDDEHGAK